MFNLFKKKPTQKVVETIVAENNAAMVGKYPTIVEQIHNEFYIAGDTLLQEAQTLLKQLEQTDLAKGKRLAKIGFGKTREAVVATETETKAITAKQMAETVAYYRMHYPNNKFITEQQVKAICEKYGLIFGDISMYKGFVPEPKLKLIEDFKLRKEDQIEFLFELTNNLPSDVRKTLPLSFITEDHFTEQGLSFVRNGKGFFFVKAAIPYSVPLVKQEVIDLFKDFRSVEANLVTHQLKICAPAKEMEIPAGKEVVGYKIQNIPDPVVLQPVKDGYLIICAWGEEASDELVVNQQMN